MKTYSIGRHPEADIVLTANFCSRDHAKLTITDTGNILLQDMSSNGTMVNGKKVLQQVIEVKFGDAVLFAGVEQLDWSKIEKPQERPVVLPGRRNPIPPFIRNNGFWILGAAVLLSGVGWWMSREAKSETVVESPVPAAEIYARYQNAVAMVEVTYYVRIETKAITLYFGIKNGKIGNDIDKNQLEPFSSQGTGFFIDSNGTLITNRHVVEPWNGKELSRYFYSEVIPTIQKALKQKGLGEDDPKPYPVPVATYIYPNGKKYSPENRLECTLLKAAADEEIDLASISILDGELPPGVSVITEDRMESNPQKLQVNTPAYVIGYPHGDILATDEENVLKCTSTTGSFTQEPAKNYVQYSAETAGGGSGSPVFNQYGKLVAVSYLGATTGQSFNRGILAKHIRTVR